MQWQYKKSAMEFLLLLRDGGVGGGGSGGSGGENI